MPSPRTTKTFEVDGVRAVISDGRSTDMHAIVRQRDFTANRIAGYAHDLPDANLWAASADLLAAGKGLLAYAKLMGWKESQPWMRMKAAIAKVKAP